MKKKSNGMMGLAKESVGVGVTTMSGNMIMGSIAGTPGFPAGGMTGMNTAMGALNLVNVGQTARVGMGIAGMMGGMRSKKKTGNSKIDKILG